MHRLVCACIGLTACLHVVGWLAAEWLSPTPRQLAWYYAASLVSLLTFYAYVSLAIRDSESHELDGPNPQPEDDCCDALAGAALLLASCTGPPLFLLMMLRPSMALVVLTFVVTAGGLSVSAYWCCARLLTSAIKPPPSPQLIMSSANSTLRSQVQLLAAGHMH
jgi:hypothetical protein